MNWIAWALLSAFFAGLTALLAKAGVEHVDSTQATAVRTAVVLVLAWMIAFAITPMGALKAWPTRTWVFLILSGVATGLSWLCYFRALQLGPVSRVAPLDKLSVVFAMVLAVTILHEKAGWQQWAGAGLMVAGALVVAWK